MDYGYRMLRHVVAQVFGNFGQAARLTLLLTFLPMGLLLVLFLSTGATLDPSMGQGDMPNPGMIGEDCNHPPEGVVETMLPH